MRRFIFLLVLSRVGLISAFFQDRDYARSVVISDHGIVATSRYLASQAGAQILAQGRTAIDAAISANAVLGVTEPMMNGIGGDLFLIYWDAKTGKLYGLNASGWAPQGLTIDFLKQHGITSMRDDGIYSVTVPGAVDGWAKAHDRFAKLPWRSLFVPAIYYAENGYTVSKIIHGFWRIGRSKLKQTQEAERLFLPSGKPPEVGEKFSNPDLGKTLRFAGRERASRILRGRNCEGDPQDIAVSGRHHANRGSVRILCVVGRPHLD